MKPYVLCVCAVLMAAFCGLPVSALQSPIGSGGGSSLGGGSSGYTAGSSSGGSGSDIADYQRDKQFRKWSK